MSEHGWRDFLSADGLGDWAVLHGGATAVFRAASLVSAAQIAAAIAATPGVTGEGVLVTLTDDRVSVRLTRDLWALEARHVAMARAISATVRRYDGVPDRGAIQEVQVAIAAKPATTDVGFWRAVLGYAPMADDNAVDPLGHGSTVWMQALKDDKPLRHAMHLDVSVPRDQVAARLASAIAAGGRIVDESQAPSHWTLADQAGNRVCICAWPDGSTRGP